MLFLPFILLFFHNDLVRAEFIHDPFSTKTECIEYLNKLAPKAAEDAPEGGSVKLGCLGTGASDKTSPSDSQKTTQL